MMSRPAGLAVYVTVWMQLISVLRVLYDYPRNCSTLLSPCFSAAPLCVMHPFSPVLATQRSEIHASDSYRYITHLVSAGLPSADGLTALSRQLDDPCWFSQRWSDVSVPAGWLLRFSTIYERNLLWSAHHLPRLPQSARTAHARFA